MSKFCIVLELCKKVQQIVYLRTSFIYHRGTKLELDLRGCRLLGPWKCVDWGTSRALRSSSSIRHIPLTNPSTSKDPDLSESQSFHMSRSLVRSSFEALHICLTVCPSKRSSGPTMSACSPESKLSRLPFSISLTCNSVSSGFVVKSTERPRQPAALRT